MKVFKNRDFAVSVLVFLLVSLSGVTTFGILYGARQALLAFALCAALFLVHYFISRFRYNAIARLSEELGSMLHGGAVLDLTQGAEGELSILRSEIYKLALKLRTQADALKREKTFLSNSMADVSHQLRTPLTALNLSLSMIKKPDTSPERKGELLQDITRLLSRLDWLVSAMLIMAKIDAGTARFAAERVELSLLVRRACAPLEISMELKGIGFKAEIAEGAGFTGDIAWSAEAVANIIKNAMEHTPPGGEIRVSGKENSLFTELIISDTGSGISETDLPHIFERFYKGKSSPDGSVGVGLAMAQLIFSEQNGSVRAKNSPQGGAVFTVRIYKAVI